MYFKHVYFCLYFQIELERLNTATDLINKLEIELDVSKMYTSPSKNLLSFCVMKIFLLKAKQHLEL